MFRVRWVVCLCKPSKWFAWITCSIQINYRMIIESFRIGLSGLMDIFYRCKCSNCSQIIFNCVHCCTLVILMWAQWETFSSLQQGPYSIIRIENAKIFDRVWRNGRKIISLFFFFKLLILFFYLMFLNLARSEKWSFRPSNKDVHLTIG